MIYGFDTEGEQYARAASVLYALYRSRSASSPMMGKETWSRFNDFARLAAMKSVTMPEFVQKFSRQAKVDSIKPAYVDPECGMDAMQDNALLRVIEDEGMYVIMLVRDRVDREKENRTEQEEMFDGLEL